MHVTDRNRGKIFLFLIFAFRDLVRAKLFRPFKNIFNFLFNWQVIEIT